MLLKSSTSREDALVFVVTHNSADLLSLGETSGSLDARVSKFESALQLNGRAARAGSAPESESPPGAGGTDLGSIRPRPSGSTGCLCLLPGAVAR